MTDKERLEVIKQTPHMFTCDVLRSNFLFLAGQAEKLQERTSELAHAKVTIDDKNFSIDLLGEQKFERDLIIKDLREQNQKLREEVEYYQRKYENTGSMFGRQAQRTLHDENKRLREALDFYAEPDSYRMEHIKGDFYQEPIQKDTGDIARKALEDLK